MIAQGGSFMTTNCSKSKNYENMRKYLDRTLKIASSSKNSRLFFDKFVQALKPTDWQNIREKDLEDYGIPHQTFSLWREEMTNRGILVCMATKEELRDKNVNYKASMFKYGAKIKKYIEAELGISIHERIDSKADEKRVEKLEENVTVLEEKVNMLESSMNNMATIILKVLPPDTPKRRDLIEEWQHDPVECMNQLRLEMEKNIKETGRMFAN